MANKATNHINNVLLIIGLMIVMQTSRHFSSINYFQGKAEFIATVHHFAPINKSNGVDFSTKLAILSQSHLATKAPYIKKCNKNYNTNCAEYAQITFLNPYFQHAEKESTILFLKNQVLRI